MIDVEPGHTPFGTPVWIATCSECGDAPEFDTRQEAEAWAGEHEAAHD